MTSRRIGPRLSHQGGPRSSPSNQVLVETGNRVHIFAPVDRVVQVPKIDENIEAFRRIISTDALSLKRCVCEWRISTAARGDEHVSLRRF